MREAELQTERRQARTQERERLNREMHDGLGRSLHGALLAWRNRWEDRLLAVGIALEWQLDPALEAVELGSDTTLQIMRILQEATTNVVKHAGASLLQVNASLAHDNLVLQISDNGCGLPPVLDCATSAGKGRGLRNMRQRCEQFGGTLQVEPLRPPQTGTSVRLTLAIGGLQPAE